MLLLSVEAPRLFQMSLRSLLEDPNMEQNLLSRVVERPRLGMPTTWRPRNYIRLLSTAPVGINVDVAGAEGVRDEEGNAGAVEGHER